MNRAEAFIKPGDYVKLREETIVHLSLRTEYTYPERVKVKKIEYDPLTDTPIFVIQDGVHKDRVTAKDLIFLRRPF